jgi:hypothetical protein
MVATKPVDFRKGAAVLPRWSNMSWATSPFWRRLGLSGEAREPD